VSAMATTTYRSFIDGHRAETDGAATFEVFDPATGKAVAQVAGAQSADVEAAVAAASNALPGWRGTPTTKRAELLRTAAARILEQRDQLAELLTREQGKPLAESGKEIEEAANDFRFFAGEAERLAGEIAPRSTPGTHSLVYREPLGVVAAIATWNYPVSLLSRKIAPALAAGCTVVAKPDPSTPLAALEMIRLAASAGLPAGVLNALVGEGDDIGAALVAHPAVAKIAFTGSTRVGSEIMRAAAKDIKRLTLELSGHSPMIVWHDADFSRAVKDGVKRAFRNAGQICNSVERYYIHEDIYEAYVEAFARDTQALVVGNGLRPEVEIGPLTHSRGLERAEEHVDDAVERGARVLAGGQRLSGDGYDGGNFFAPTVLRDVGHGMAVMDVETFGPVAPLMKVGGDLGEVIDLANELPYGLVSYVYTQSLRHAFEAIERIEAGSVGINTVSAASIHAPYGGIKRSGYGIEYSPHAIDEYTYFKHAVVTFY
jgi:succinate-semialdehyde dehydrogenase / glutarate-semialdehyde dehydrogenase